MKCPLVHRFKFRELVSQQGHKATRLFIPPTSSVNNWESGLDLNIPGTGCPLATSPPVAKQEL